MKTRSNMPLFVLEVSDVKALSNSQIDLLRCGDYLVKKDASGEHAYKVTFKSDTGMCLTYHDASVIETQSYDKVEGNWVYNSEDKTENLLDVATKDDIEGGTLENAKPIYCHPIYLDFNPQSGDYVGRRYLITCLIFNNDATPFTLATFLSFVNDLCINYNAKIMCSGGVYDTENTILVSCMRYVPVGAEQVCICGLKAGTKQEELVGLSSISAEHTSFEDGVNKIN